jgi:phosphohistidine phosphatase SixA
MVVRHAQTDANRITRVLYGKEGASINELGVSQAKKLASELSSYGIDPNTEPVAVSELKRTYQTATEAGFKNIVINPLLNEVMTNKPAKTQQLVKSQRVPEEALRVARALLANPPKEKFLITHGLVIAALAIELGVDYENNLIPRFCEIREFTF